MSKGKRKTITKALLVGFCCSLCGGLIYTALPKSVEAKAAGSSFSEVAGQNFDATDYQFVGYSLRFDEQGAVASNSVNSAMRFKMEVSEEMYNYVSGTENVKTGTLIYPAYYLEDRDVANLTVTTSAGEANDIVPLNLETTDAWQKVEGGTAYQSVTYLREIPAEFYSTKIAVRGYLQVGENYYYTEATEARAFSYVVNEEKNDAESSFSGQEKAAFTELFLKFPVTIDGIKQSVYYGESIAPMEDTEGGFFLYYTQGDKVFTPNVSKIVGRAKLTSVWATVNSYYSEKTKSGTFEVKGLPAGITSAEIDGRTIPCTTTEGAVTLSNVSDLEMGKNYLMTLKDSQEKEYKVGFKTVANIINNVSYAAGDELGIDFGTGVTIQKVKDTAGMELGFRGKVLTEIGQTLGTGDIKELLVTDTAGSVHKLTLKMFDKVFYTADDVNAFLFGTKEGKYKDSEYYLGAIKGTYALGADIDLGLIKSMDSKIPALYKGGNISFQGVFDGNGYTLTWTIDPKAYAEQSGEAFDTLQVASGKGSLFGYYFRGTLQNIALHVNFENIEKMKHTFLVVAEYCYNATLDNVAVVFDMKGDIMDTTRFGIGAMSANSKLTLNNTTIIHTQGKSATNYSRHLLWHRELAMDKVTEGVMTSAGKQAFDETTKQSNREIANFTNANFIIPDGVEGALGHMGTAVNDAYYACAENQTMGLNEETGTNLGFQYLGTTLHDYTAAKSGLSQVGSWKINYGESISEISVEYVG